jgi:hypothetical protein
MKKLIALCISLLMFAVVMPSFAGVPGMNWDNDVGMEISQHIDYINPVILSDELNLTLATEPPGYVPEQIALPFIWPISCSVIYSYNHYFSVSQAMLERNDINTSIVNCLNSSTKNKYQSLNNGGLFRLDIGEITAYPNPVLT